jgi:ABC-type antimicrobial peptide transport system permease subunit
MTGRLKLVLVMTLRDLRHRAFESLLMMLVLTVGAAVLTASLALRQVNNDPYEQTKKVTQGPDVVAQLMPPFFYGGNSGLADASKLRSLQQGADIEATSGPYPALHSSIVWRGKPVDVYVIGRDRATSTIDQPKLTKGHWVTSGNVVVEKAFADSLHLSVGQQLVIDGHTFHIGGIAVTSALPAYPQTTQLAWWASQGPGVVWLDRSDQASLVTPTSEQGYLLNIKLKDPAATDTFIASRMDSSVQFTSWQAIAAAANQTIESEQQALAFGATLLAVLALASITLVVGRRMSEQTRRVGLFKAVGASPQFVALILVVGNAIIAIAGSAVGLVIGSLLTKPLTNVGAGLIGSAGQQPITPLTIIVVLIVALLVTALATINPVIKAVRRSTADSLRGASRAPKRHGLLSDVAVHLPMPGLIGLRIATRRMRQSILSTIGVAVTVMGIVVVMATHTFYAELNGRSNVPDPWTDRLNELIAGMTVLMALITAVNILFLTWTAIADNRRIAALHRALGATPFQVSTGLALAQVGPAAVGALLGIPAGLVLNQMLRHGVMTFPPTWTLLALLVGAPLVALVLVAAPAFASTKQSPASVLQAETT